MVMSNIAAYVSRSLKSSERNYSQIEKEDLAIVLGVTKYYTNLVPWHKDVGSNFYGKSISKEGAIRNRVNYLTISLMLPVTDCDI